MRSPRTWPPSDTAARRRLLRATLAGAVLLRCGLTVHAAGAPAAAFELVTDDEAAREARAAAAAPPVVPRSRGVPQPPGPGDAPAIQIIAPAGEAAVSSPLRLEVAFSPAPDARIVPDSFRVLYGVLKIDLTERLQRHSRLSERGVVVEGAQVPQGTHRLLVRVADDKGRMAEQAIVFHVAGRQ